MPEARVVPRIAAAALAVVSTFIAMLARGEDVAKPSHHIAVVAAAAETGLADMVAVELSKQPDVALVEREMIARVLDELTLSPAQAANTQTALKLGELLAADALLFIEPEPKAEPPRIRLRLIETRTGVRLGDWPESAARLKAGDHGEVLAELRQATAKLGIATKDRHLVGVIGIRNEVENPELVVLSKALTAFIERDLQAMPDVVVLERDQLRRLTDERDLTGVELALKASSRLVEGGVRRDGDKLTVTLKLLPLKGGARRETQFTSTTDLVTVRRRAVEALAALLGAEPRSLPTPADAAAESAHFTARIERFVNRSDYAEAMSLAEAAYALNPNMNTFRAAREVYWRHYQWLGQGLSINPDLYPTPEAVRIARLESMLRVAQLFRDCYEHCAADPKLEAAFPLDFLLCYGVPASGVSDAERRLWAEHSRVAHATYERMLAVRRAAGTTGAASVILQRLATTGMGDPKKCNDFLLEIERELAREAAAGRMPEDRVRFDTRHQNLLWGMVHAGIDSPAPPLNDIRPFLESMAASEVSALRMIGWSRLIELPDATGIDLAERFLETLFSGEVPHALGFLDEMRYNKQGTVVHVPLAGESRFKGIAGPATKAGERLAAAGRLSACIDRVITKAEADHDVVRLIEWNDALIAVIGLDRNRTEGYAKRIDELIATRAYPWKAEFLVEAYKSRSAAIDRSPRQLPQPKAGRLDGYEVREVRITNPEPGFETLAMVHIDRTPDGDPRRPLVLVWSKGRRSPSGQPNDPTEFDYLIGRAATAGGDMTVVGRCRLPLPVVLDMASAGGLHFFGTARHGLAMVDARGTTMIAEAEGLPTGRVGPMAWLDGRLYAAVTDAFFAIDPTTKTCEVIASGRSVTSRNPLDGRGECKIQGVAADPDRGRLLILVSWGKPGGVWSYTPRSNAWKRLTTDGVSEPVRGDKDVLYRLHGARSGDVWCRLDLATSTITPLEGYKGRPLIQMNEVERGVGVSLEQRNPHWAMLDDLLFFPGTAIDGSGVTHTWRPGLDCRDQIIHRVGDEIVVFDEPGNRLFAIRKRQPEAAQDAAPPRVQQK